MDTIERKTVCVIAALLLPCFIAGCQEQYVAGRGVEGLETTTDLGTTIGSLVDVISPESFPVEGYGMVSGLSGTGSADCPPQIRAYLTQYILKQSPAGKIDVEKFIASPDTAVVLVEGTMPAIAAKGQYFDVSVTALSGTQTTSLEGGWLFGTDLKMAGSFGIATQILADAKGPIFIDKIDTSKIDKRSGYILAGGKVLNDYRLSLVLSRQDFKIANSIRNRLNERFGAGVARAILPERIEMTVPAQYRERKQRFVSIIEAMYLTATPEITTERIKTFVGKLAGSEDKYASEIALEAIGKESLGKLSILLNSSNERVRLHAARCMLNLDSDAGLVTLRQIATDESSVYRLEALEAIAFSARRNDAVAIARNLLRDDDFRIRLAAYEQLRRLDDISITREFIAGTFYLEQIAQTEHKTIYVSRSSQPRIVLFGAPILCRDGIFISSDDGEITINAPAGQEYVTVIRKHPKRPSVIAQLKSSFELGDIIRTLCEEPSEAGQQRRGGLGISYADVIVLLKQMCEKGAVQAEFQAGPLPKIG